MKLTGLAREQFYNWYEEKAHVSNFLKTRNVAIVHFISKSECCQNAIIIEWLDSLGIWKNTYNNFYVKYFRNEMTLTEATKQAIIKTNEIFNLNVN